MTEKGFQEIEEIEYHELKIAIIPFLSTCEAIFLKKFPETRKSLKFARLLAFKTEYPNSFVEKLKNETMEFIKQYIQEI